ncbi:MAG TPA: hypothetical protein VGI03_09520 [Verrucomicrobiae bacterium]
MLTDDGALWVDKQPTSKTERNQKSSGAFIFWWWFFVCVLFPVVFGNNLQNSQKPQNATHSYPDCKSPSSPRVSLVIVPIAINSGHVTNHKSYEQQKKAIFGQSG